MMATPHLRGAARPCRVHCERQRVTGERGTSTIMVSIAFISTPSYGAPVRFRAKRRAVLFIVALFILTRVLAALAGVRYDASVGSLMHMADPALLRASVRRFRRWRAS